MEQVLEAVSLRILGTLVLSSELACVSTSLELIHCKQGCIINEGLALNKRYSSQAQLLPKMYQKSSMFIFK